ncbi:aldo/keto reductase [Nocardioides sp. zg-536]|uniref:Aldo/keto reductase n=1 Tax=Nocardioides faecalis TaxID=2803858 RepID=A0A939BY57_9ACTN|nr:aldo/keto reductase [Nocardioides faecalis]MBM9460003.1 aldo/keto reductase [Nocardioides faecalis]QVI58776.1 aldo/keto reductase [Nocardioides faecalis]
MQILNSYATPYHPVAERYDAMEYRSLGRSGLKMPALSLGFWHNFGDDKPLQVQRDIMRTAFDHGITHWDLANNYGPPAGSAESNVGLIFAQDFKHLRDELLITSKAGFALRPGPYGAWGSKKYLVHSLDQTLLKLGIDYVDIYYHHLDDPDTPIEETAEALALAVTSGKALYVGVSNYPAERLREMAAALAQWRIPLRAYQGPYSMFDREIEESVLPTAADLGVGTIAYSPLQQGLLTDRYLDGTVPADSRAARGKFLHEKALSSAYYERATALQGIAERRGQTLAQLALTWVLRDPAVSSAIIGASSVEQLRSNLAALAADLSDDEVAAIEPYAVHGTGARTW